MHIVTWLVDNRWWIIAAVLAAGSAYCFWRAYISGEMRGLLPNLSERP